MLKREVGGGGDGGRDSRHRPACDGVGLELGITCLTASEQPPLDILEEGLMEFCGRRGIEVLWKFLL